MWHFPRTWNKVEVLRVGRASSDGSQRFASDGRKLLDKYYADLIGGQGWGAHYGLAIEVTLEGLSRRSHIRVS